MKKLLPLLLFICFATSASANLYQSNWRWRNDNGTEVTATWKAAVNTPIVMISKIEIMRLRMLMYNNDCCNNDGRTQELQYSTNVGGPWVTISTTESSNHFVIVPSSQVANNSFTTSQIGRAGYTFVAGRVISNMNSVACLTSGTQYHENEWVIKGTVNTMGSTTYYFRNQSSSGWDTYPSLTTAAVLPVQWVSFSATRKNNKVRLNWITASEQNNDRFEVMRSTDGRNWSKIGTLSGQGTTSIASNYQFTDEQPISGQNYYMIRQVDSDGRTQQSDNKSVLMPDQANIVVQVYPNPTNADIGFSILNKNVANLEATLVNAAGTVVHKQLFRNVTAQALNQLQLTGKAAAGVYILKVQAAGLNETRSIIIQ